jgi:hypothetical protein
MRFAEVVSEFKEIVRVTAADLSWHERPQLPDQDRALYGEDAMAAKRTWSDLDESTRKLIITVAVVEGILKVAALIDIKRRPASQIRGPKWLWAPLVAVVNSARVVPISYFVFGRRRPQSQSG